MEPRKRKLLKKKPQSRQTPKAHPRRLKVPVSIPDNCECPIPLEVMQDPVTAADGQHYEGEAINSWFLTGSMTSPLTQTELSHKKLIPHHALKKAIPRLLAQSAPPMPDPRLVTLAKQKANPRAPIAGTLLKMESDEAALEGLREEMAANMIKRLYFRKRLKSWLNASRLHERKEWWSHQLEQSIASEQKAHQVAQIKLMEQERLDKAALEQLKNDYEARTTQSAAKGKWEKIGQLAKEVEAAQKKLKEKQQKAIGSMKQAHDNQIVGYHAEQVRLRDALEQVTLAKADKIKGILERVKPISQLTERLHITKQKCQTLLDHQDEAATLLKDQIAASRLSLAGLFKPLAKPRLDSKQAPKPEPLDAKTLKAAKKVLEHVAWGRQDEAEAFLKVRPSLAFVCGEVEEPCSRRWQRISPFELAVWGLDWHMWKMMLKCFREEHYAKAAEQYQELEEKGTEHGKQFSMQPLIDALQTYYEKSSSWTKQQCKDHWQKIVGGEQGKLPMSVVHEYCRPDRSFEPTRNMFEENTLPRWKGREEEWFHSNNSKEDTRYKYTIGGLGGDWAWIREHFFTVWSVGNMMPDHAYIVHDIRTLEVDRQALLLMTMVRNQQKSKLGQMLSAKTGAGLTLMALT